MTVCFHAPLPPSSSLCRRSAEAYADVVFWVPRDRRSTLQIVLSFEPRCDLLNHFATIGVVVWSFLDNVHLPTVPVRLNRNRHVGRPLADVLHFYLDRSF